MKNIYYYISFLATLALLFTSSCNSFLEEEAFDTFTTDNFPSSADDAQALTGEIYLTLGNAYAGRHFFLSELHSEIATTRRSGGDRRARIDNYEVDENVDYLENYWVDNYVSIKQANGVISFFEESDGGIDPALASQLLAEAKVLRATAYFNLVIMYGSVPLNIGLVGSIDEAATPLSPISDIYNQIIKDLTEAEPNLPHSYSATNEQGRVTRGAARAMLGKVHLQRGADPTGVGSANDFVMAESWFRKVVTAEGGGQSYTLESDFNNLFGLENVELSKFSNEIVYQLWRDGADCCDNGFHGHLNPTGSPYGSAAWGNVVAEIPFYLSFEDTDERFAVTFLDTIDTGNGQLIHDVNNPGVDGFRHDGVPFQKGIDPNAVGDSGGNNFFLVRYADVLLSLAESIFRQGNVSDEAMALVNEVRVRAGLEGLSTGMSNTDFEVALYDERRWELAMEGHSLADGQRFFDLFKQRVEAAPNYVQPAVPEGMTQDGGRRSDAVPDIPITVTLENIRYPIPASEKRTNPSVE